MEPGLPSEDFISAWEPAAKAVAHGITRPWFAGMTGAAARVAAGSCRPAAEPWTDADTEADRTGGLAGLWRLGLRAIPIQRDPQDSGRSARMLARCSASGAPEVRFTYASGADVTYVVKRCSGRIGSRRQRTALALAEWAAESLQPARPALCSDGTMGSHGVGIAAYPRLAEAAAEAQIGREHASTELRLLRWIALREAGAAFLRELAGTRRTAYANRLRWAADGCDDEIAQALRPALAAMRAGNSAGDAAGMLDHARRMAEHAAGLVLEAAIMAAGFAPAARSAMSEEPEADLHGTALQEIIYLCRASAPPYRQLAARRLAGSDHSQAVSTLSQLAYAEVPGIGHTAIAALTKPPDARRYSALCGVLRGLLQMPEEVDGSRAAAALLALADWPEGAPDVLIAAAADSGAPLLAAAARATADRAGRAP